MAAQSTVECSDNGSMIETPERTCAALWKSVWLSRLTLMGIGLLFAALTVALLVLWKYNMQYRGFVLITSNHYSWTYGPTALLVLVAALWRQIDFHCKTMAPWVALREKPQMGSQSMSLDYISPMQIYSLWKALKNKHFIVMTSIVGFMLLKVVTLISTGLFITVPTIQHYPSLDLIQLNSFNGSAVNVTSFPTLNDSSLVYTAYGILASGLSYPEGTSESLVYETFMPSSTDSLTNLKVTTTVKAVVPAFHCESAPVGVDPNFPNTTDEHPILSLQLQFPECQLIGGGQGVDGTPVYTLNPQTFKCPARQLSPLLQRISCFNQTDPNTQDNWQLLTLADIRYNQTLTGSDETAIVGESVQASSWVTSIPGLTGIACRSSYTIERVNVTYDYSQNPVKVTITRPSEPSQEKLEDFTDFDLGRLFTASLSAAAEMFGNVLDNAYAEEYPNTMFKIMAQVAGGGYEALLDEPTMIKTAEKAFQQVAVQIIKKNLAQAVSLRTTGQASYTQERLRINDVSLWSMVGGFGVMIVIAVFFILTRKQDATPRDPTSTLSAALILRPNKLLHDVLQTSAGYEEDQFAANLQNYTFTSRIANLDSSGRQFVVSVNGSVPDIQSPRDDTEPGWWRPLGANRAFVSAALALPVAIIAVLEVLQRQSDRNSGIASVSDVESLPSKIFTRYLPALIMLLSATMFDSLEFLSIVLAPYNAMKANRQPSTPVSRSLVGLMPLHALWTALRSRYWGSSLAIIAALLGSVLTIVSSGLYTIDSVPVTSPVQIQSTDSFNTTWGNSVLNDSGAAVLTSLSESLNLTYPRFTHEEFALPGLQTTTSQTSGPVDTDAMLSVELPSLRASLNCTSFGLSQFNVTTSYNPKVGPGATVRAVGSLPEQCLFGGPGGNLTSIEFERSFQFPYTQNRSYIGKILDLHVGPFDPVHELSEDELSPTTQRDNPPGCPSLGFIYGFVDVNDASQTSVSVLMCDQNMQQLPTTVHLTLPDLSISSDSPPIPDDTVSKFLPSGPSGETAFSYRLQTHIDTELSLFNQTEYDSSNLDQSTVDRFFQGVLFGKYPIPQSWLAESGRATEVRASIQAFYRRYMAQAISANMRIPTLASEARLFNGSMTVKNGVLRVKQNNASKITLQALLGTMFLCGSLAMFLSTTREVVPYNPCTIAGDMALWAGSRFCRDPAVHNGPDCGDVPLLPKEAEFMDDKTLMRSGVLNGWVFKLGWWETDDGIRRYGIDVVKKEVD
ncbi:hypothetical protein Z517_06935 [Fonsecaea pedrosoi CBS 271.37]|uniref:Unplaced genomic scaffold supercont1.4, whole genome shotgun sequence n=1 Tax=Fonsecaea pedrosoi CBS 271.37 TaxID=1442368 RepID=A0A0D2GP40_9EURO|nr:uncharacterized protein Z517_06935 [Fonsecaea pedrosoi CBS 271.37]KIW80320.1 hypothetical protein Z517_06935 [Fonsecaea pedrosoi CBS 271.37]